MSASLVGSEMCIRDRVVGTPKPASKRPTAQARASAVPLWSLYGRRVPVSYTHLTLPTICSV
eukprot:1222770-Alexandrium_andersonii.AAC.1